MGLCAEKTVKDYQLSREEQDKFALSSYERVSNAWKNGDFQAEVVSVSIKQRRGPALVVSEDEEYKKLNKEKVDNNYFNYIL